MNIELLKRTAAYMLQYPEGVDVMSWASGTYIADKQDGPPCGTTACIGGTAWALEHGAVSPQTIYDMSAGTTDCYDQLLGLNQLQGDKLFLLELWPKSFSYAYQDAGNPQTRAQVVHDRIMAFIESGGEI